MKLLRISKWRLFPLGAMVIFLYGFSNIELADIETALIEKDYQKAKTLSQDFLKQAPSLAKKDEAYYYMGVSQLWLAQYAEARDSFRHLIRYSSEIRMQDKARLGIIDSYLMDEKYTEALKEAEVLLRLSPKSEYLSLIYFKLARANLKLTQWDKAQEYLKKIINQFPDSPEAHLAKQLLEEKQYFAVQLGAFLEQKRAENLLQELKQKDEYSYIVETVDKEGRKFYRVRVGQLATLAEARELRSKMSRLGYPTQIFP